MNAILFGFGLGGYEVMVVLFVILLLFGGKKIPELARGLGKGIREFNSAKASIETEIKEGIKEADTKEADSKKVAEGKTE